MLSGSDPTAQLIGQLGDMAIGIAGVAAAGKITSAARTAAAELEVSVPRSAAAGINPRLVERLEAWRGYQASGGSMSMARWVKATQGNAAYGMGFKSGYASWIRSIESTHGNSLLSSRMAYLYRMEDANGSFLKWGVTQNLYKRYTGDFARDIALRKIAEGRRADMLGLERDLIETFPGPLNNEQWAGARIGGW